MNTREANICIFPQTAHFFGVFFCPNLGHELFYPTLHAQKVESRLTVLPSFPVLNGPLGTLIHFERARFASVAGGNSQT